MVKTDYDNFAFVTACYPLSESTTKQVVYVLVRSKKCWAEHNKDFIELELDKLADLGFYTGNLEDVTQTGKSADFLTNSSNFFSVLIILQSECNDGWERIDCDLDKSSGSSNLDVAEILNVIDSFLDSIIGSIFSQ